MRQTKASVEWKINKKGAVTTAKTYNLPGISKSKLERPSNDFMNLLKTAADDEENFGQTKPTPRKNNASK